MADGANGGSIEISTTSITGNIARREGFGGAIFFEPTDPPDGTEISVKASAVSNNNALGSKSFGGAIFYDPSSIPARRL